MDDLDKNIAKEFTARNKHKHYTYWTILTVSGCFVFIIVESSYQSPSKHLGVEQQKQPDPHGRCSLPELNNQVVPLHSSVTSSDKKHFVDVYQKEQGSDTTSADVESYQQLPSKHQRDEELEQPGPHGRSPVN